MKPKFVEIVNIAWSSLHDLLWIVAKEYRQLRVVTENVTAAVLHHKKQTQFLNQTLTQKNI